MLDELATLGSRTPFKNGTAQFCPLYCFIHCTNGMIITVDPWNWIRLHKFTWIAKKSRGGYYAFRKYQHGRKVFFVYMHREITACPKGLQTHHRNGLTLFNVELNLAVKGQPAHLELHKMRKIQRRLAIN